MACKSAVTIGQCNTQYKWEYKLSTKLHCALLPGTQSSLAEPGESKIQNNNSKRRLSKKSNAATIFHLTYAFGLIFLIFLSLWKKNYKQTKR